MYVINVSPIQVTWQPYDITKPKGHRFHKTTHSAVPILQIVFMVIILLCVVLIHQYVSGARDWWVSTTDTSKSHLFITTLITRPLSQGLSKPVCILYSGLVGRSLAIVGLSAATEGHQTDTKNHQNNARFHVDARLEYETKRTSFMFELRFFKMLPGLNELNAWISNHTHVGCCSSIL